MEFAKANPRTNPGSKRCGLATGSLPSVPDIGSDFIGGPIAHLGYFRNQLVLRPQWIDEAGYADLVALCQFLPGPGSSQVGFSLGVLRGNGILGGLAAWAAFTLPSAFVLFAFAFAAGAFTGPLAEGFLHGLKLVAVAVVAQAVWGMTHLLTPDKPRAAIALAALAIVTFIGGSYGQIGAIGLGAVAGLLFCTGTGLLTPGHLRFPVSPLQGVVALSLFAAFFVVPPFVAAATSNSAVAIFEAFYRSGALVFGGGHVVLPLLQNAVVTPGWVRNDDFLAGYGLAQAVPGPLFTFAALSWRGHRASAKWRHGRSSGTRGDIFARGFVGLWHASLLGCLPCTPVGAGGDAWDERGRRRYPRRGAL